MSSLKERLPKQGGFTIIEVVLVLAIAGLIFLIVFLALPQLQRSRRDTQRRSDAGRFLAALESYAQNNNGRYPADVGDPYQDIIDDYLTVDGAVFDDPQEGPYTLVASASDVDVAGELSVEDGETCDGSGNSRDIAVTVFVEEGGTYCQDNR